MASKQARNSFEHPFDLLTVAAHQMSSPISAVSMVLDVLLGEYAGPISPKQRELLERASARCQESVDSLRRILSIARAAGEPGGVSADAADILRRAESRFSGEAAKRNIELTADAPADPLYVVGRDAAITEVVEALLDNAMKYCPDSGRIMTSLKQANGYVELTVGDSGIGIPEDEREAVFLPFYRTSAAMSTNRAGIGLGLAFVKAVVESLGGSVAASKSPLGGAEFVVKLPPGIAPEISEGVDELKKVMKVVVIGGVAAGPKVASKIIRLKPDAEVTVVEKGEFLSYAGCGLPYYVSGVVREPNELMSTPAGILRDPAFFQNVKNVHVFNRTEAVEIDRQGKRVRIRPTRGGEDSWLSYDKLVITTGRQPVIPPIPGIKLRNVFTLHGVQDAEGIKAALAEGKARDVIIVGGGLIGVEMTEALVSRGCRVTIVEMLPEILRILDPEMAMLVERHLESQGVKVLTSTRVVSFEGTDHVTGVVTEAGTFPADLAILAIGVRANVSLARAAGLKIGETGGIAVDDHMRTSDPDIYAAGDCVECTDLVTGRPAYVPLGSTANKQGRVAAVNICGGDDRFPGIVGSTICKVFEYAVARTGLTETAALKLGFCVGSVLAPGPDKAEYMPSTKPLLLKLVFDFGTRKLLGAQAVGPGNCDRRIDVAAMALTAGMTIDQLANADLTYAPPYSPAMDNIITAANVARNKADGYMNGISPMEVHEMLAAKKDFVFLDVRTPGEYQQVRLPASTHIPLGALRGPLRELPRDKQIITFCKVSLRGYEAALILKAAGCKDVKVLDGGIAMWPFEKLT